MEAFEVAQHQVVQRCRETIWAFTHPSLNAQNQAQEQTLLKRRAYSPFACSEEIQVTQSDPGELTGERLGWREEGRQKEKPSLENRRQDWLRQQCAAAAWSGAGDNQVSQGQQGETGLINRLKMVNKEKRKMGADATKTCKM